MAISIPFAMPTDAIDLWVCAHCGGRLRVQSPEPTFGRDEAGRDSAHSNGRRTLGATRHVVKQQGPPEFGTRRLSQTVH